MKRIFVFAVLLSSSPVAIAENCSDATNDPELFFCIERHHQASEARLNDEYAAVKKRIDRVFVNEPEVKKQYLAMFIESQRGWLKYRENQCKLYAHVADKNSNSYILFTNDCTIKINEERIKQLRQIPYDG